MYDQRLQYVSLQDAQCLSESLEADDVSSAWLVWSRAAETALADAYHLSGGPIPSRGLVLGRGVQLIFLGLHILDTRGGVVPRVLWGFIHLRFGRGWDNSLCGACPRLRLARSEISCLLRCMREMM